MYSVLYKKEMFFNACISFNVFLGWLTICCCHFFMALNFIILYIEFYIFKDVAYSGFDLSNSNYYEVQCHE